jgi:leucyl aminopeptidase
MADALSYGIKKFKPETVMDFATLTGACIQALGNTMTGIVSNSDELYKKVESASLLSQNQIWRLPLIDYFREKVDGDISDYKNYTSGVGAGASMAAAFLEKFVEEKPWVHFDIAGTAFYDSKIGNTPKGATGQPLKLVYEFLKNY